jgi:four helix bundle protein
MRAALSISANITEGCGRRTAGEWRHYLCTSLGSLCEVEGYLDLARDALVLDHAAHFALTTRTTVCKRMLIGLINRAPP